MKRLRQFGFAKKDRSPLADLLVVGLGNPGERYGLTRHNAGAWVVHEIATRWGVELKAKKRDLAGVAKIEIASKRVLMAEPKTFMNLSGEAVAPLVRHNNLADLKHLVVVHDDLDIGPGRIQIKVGGGLAGHNGLKSIASHLRSQEFVRLRIGIGKPLPHTMSASDYVLRRLSANERKGFDEVVALAADAIEFLAVNDLGAAMNMFNRKQ